MEVLAGEPDNTFDALLCDPPYGLSFMGKDWDAEVPGVEVWREVYRVLKPGAFGLVFGGTRTFPFLALALVEAGFELRDTICYLYGSGFPKSTAIGKAIDKAAGAERGVVGPRVRLGDKKAYAHNDEGGIFEPGGQGLDGFRKPSTAPATPEAATWEGYGTALKPAWEPVLVIRKPPEPVTREELHALTGWNYWVVVTSKSQGLPKNHRLETLRYRPLAPGLREARFYFLFVKRGETEEMTYLGGRSEADGSNWSTVCEQANALKWGTGALWIDGGRVGTGFDRSSGGLARIGSVFQSGYQEKRPSAGRWPANVVLSHTPECKLRGAKRVKGAGWTEEDTTASTSFFRREGVGSKHYVDADGLETVEDWDCSPDCPVRLLDEQSGERPSGGAGEPETQTANCYWKFPRRVGGQQQPSTGGASRFMYCAKASPAERNAGCEGLEDVSCGTGALRDGCRGKIARNHHPTVKPIDLCRWLATLLLPPKRETPRRLLVPFAGSGSEMVGAHLAGWDEIIGIELNPEYVEIQRRRCAWWAEHGAAGPDPAVVLAEGQARDEEKAAGQLELRGIETSK